MRVLLIRLGAMGDIVHTLPLAADLARAGHAVHWLCERRWAPLIDGSAAVAQVHRCDRRSDRGSWRRLARQLRRLGFAAAIDAQGLAKSAWWLGSVAAPIRIGFDCSRARECAWLMANRRLRSLGHHVIDQQRSLGRALGTCADCPPSFPLPLDDEARMWAATVLSEWGQAGPWALNVGAGWPTKVWPQAMQIAFLDLLAERGERPLVLWGSPGERQVAEALVASCPVAVLAPPSNLRQLTALVAGCRVVVSGDTGPLHVAAALRTPTVGLFGPVPPERNGPRGPRHPNLQATAPPWERRRAERVDWSAVTPEAVLNAGDQAIAGVA